MNFWLVSRFFWFCFETRDTGCWFSAPPAGSDVGVTPAESVAATDDERERANTDEVAYSRKSVANRERMRQSNTNIKMHYKENVNKNNQSLHVISYFHHFRTVNKVR